MRTATRKPGPPPLPRRRVNPALYAAVRASGRPGYLIALEAGLTHQPVLSALVCAESVPDTPTNIERLQRIADVVRFPREDLFLDEAGR